MVKIMKTLFFFFLSSIFFIRRKYWNRENFCLLIFHNFTYFGIIRIRFLENVCLWRNFLCHLLNRITQNIYRKKVNWFNLGILILKESVAIHFFFTFFKTISHYFLNGILSNLVREMPVSQTYGKEINKNKANVIFQLL